MSVGARSIRRAIIGRRSETSVDYLAVLPLVETSSEEMRRRKSIDRVDRDGRRPTGAIFSTFVH